MLPYINGQDYEKMVDKKYDNLCIIKNTTGKPKTTLVLAEMSKFEDAEITKSISQIDPEM